MNVAKKSNSSAQKPNVFDYEDIGSLLIDWIEFLKGNNKKSLRSISNESTVSIGYLSMVLSGKRRLTENALEKILPHLKLTSQEKRFFQLLYLVGNSEIASTRVDALSEMAKLSKFKKTNEKEHDTYRYLTKWYYVVIREMVLLPDFKSDPIWIQERLRGKIEQIEIKEALHFLISKKFIVQDDMGNFFLPDLDLNCKEGIYKVSLGEFHRQVLELAHKSIHEVSREKRYILGRTVGISSSEFEQAKEIFDEALQKIEALGKDPHQTKEIYHFEFAAFPMTEKQDGEK